MSRAFVLHDSLHDLCGCVIDATSSHGVTVSQGKTLQLSDDTSEWRPTSQSRATAKVVHERHTFRCLGADRFDRGRFHLLHRRVGHPGGPRAGAPPPLQPLCCASHLLAVDSVCEETSRVAEWMRGRGRGRETNLQTSVLLYLGSGLAEGGVELPPRRALAHPEYLSLPVSNVGTLCSSIDLGHPGACEPIFQRLKFSDDIITSAIARTARPQDGFQFPRRTSPASLTYLGPLRMNRGRDDDTPRRSIILSLI